MTPLSPLLDPLRNQGLRLSHRVTDQLLMRLLLQGGPALTVDGLDLLVAYGPLTGLPGLLTRYDVREFARRNQALIEQLLRHCWPADAALPPELALLSPRRCRQPLPPLVRQRRRCRAAVYLAVCTAAGHHGALFELARHYERRRRTPPATPSFPAV